MKVFEDIYDRPIEPGQRVLLSYFGYLKDCYYLYSTKLVMAFSVYIPSKDKSLIGLSSLDRQEKIKERLYNPLFHNSYAYCRHVYKGSYYIIDSDKDNLPEQLKRFLKV